MKKLLIILLFLPLFSKAQESDMIGQSKKFIEQSMREANIKIVSDKKEEQRFMFDEIGTIFFWLWVFYYDENDYCVVQAQIIKVPLDKAVAMEDKLKSNYFGKCKEIERDKFKCGNNLVQLKRKTSEDRDFVVITASWSSDN